MILIAFLARVLQAGPRTLKELVIKKPSALCQQQWPGLSSLEGIKPLSEQPARFVC